MTTQTETAQRPVLVVDFGAQYAQLIARRVREAGVYSEIVPHTATADEIAAKNPVGIILSGGPSSVYEEGAPQLDTAVFDLGVPTLGICYGFQYMAKSLGGEVANTGLREYGATDATIVTDNVLLRGQPVEQNVWMSHGDQVAQAPAGFEVFARTAATPVAESGDGRGGGAGEHLE
ncbi:MAG: glutamine-hydrolyzing GMP synthase, partial [Microbacterium sp.]